MSPRVFKDGELVFWFHSHDALQEIRASVHVGKGSQNDAGDPKIWLEPAVEIARAGRTLNQQELKNAIKIIKKITNAYSKRGASTNKQTKKRAVWYNIPYPASAYTFPKRARIRTARFDKNYLRLELTDKRILAIPIEWIPTVCNATPAEREKYEISRDRTMLIWDPDKCAINDEVRLADYLGPNG
jgi:hypothetical protein